MTDSEDDRDPLEILAEEFLERRRNGDDVSIAEYELRYPDIASDIRDVFPAVMAMETAKPATTIAPPLESVEAVAKGRVRRLGDFRIIRKIAHGGMGVVYEAEESSLGRKVALKVLAANLLSSKSNVERFHREAKTIARLHHTNIVSVFGAGFDEDVHFFVMQFIDGKSLERMMQDGDFETKHKNDWHWIAEVLKRVALALRHAHSQNVLHRDVKPGNILIDQDSKPWVTDFGLAKFDENEDLTRPGDAVGTLRYMAPEQLAGKPDRRSDIFGLGLVMYELLTGEKAYGRSKASDLIARITHHDLELPSAINPRVPRDLELIMLKATAKIPDERYQNAVDFADDLDRWQHDLPISARRLNVFQAVYRWGKRNPLVASLSSAIFGLFLVLVVVFFYIAIAWSNERSATLDAKFAQLAMSKQQKDAESNVEIAMNVVDSLTSDLFVQVRGESDPNGMRQYLFSPYGGVPVSKETEQKLLAVQDFYSNVSESAAFHDEVKFRAALSNIRASEIAVQLGDYPNASVQLTKIKQELLLNEDVRLKRLVIYATDLLAYSEMQMQNYDSANRLYQLQIDEISKLELSDSEKKIELGRAYFGLSLVEHQKGNVTKWFENVSRAIVQLEGEVEFDEPTTTPRAALFLSRSYLNLPPKYKRDGYDHYAKECRMRAVDLLRQLHASASLNTSLNRRVYLYDYSVGLSRIDSRDGEVRFSNGTSQKLDDLLFEVISDCEKVVRGQPRVYLFRLALARCQLKMGEVRPGEFLKYSLSALANVEAVIEEIPGDPAFLTECGNINFRIASHYFATRDLKEAKIYFQKSINSLTRSMEVSRLYPRAQVMMPIAHMRLALVFDELGDPKASKFHRDQEAMYRRMYPHPDNADASQ